MQVLIIKTSSMGDVIHTLPALTDAMQAIPGISFDWVVEEGFSQIPSWHPAVDRVLPVAIRRWRKRWFSTQHRQERRQFRQQLQQRHYDLVIDAQGLLKSAALITRLARGEKHGGDRLSAREAWASWWFDKKHRVSPKLHAVERTRLLFAKSLDYHKPEQAGNYAIASHFTDQRSSTRQPYLLFLHATTRDDKHWPESHWRQLIADLKDSGLRLKLPWGAEHEQHRAIRLAEGFEHVEVLPRLSLAEIAEQLALARAVVSVDTGLSHLAAALDRPNITLYGPTDPGLIGGYGQNQYPLRPKHGNAMTDIAPQTVKQLLFKIMSD